MIPAISYIRVSTEEQDPENQRVYLEKWASERGGFTIVKHYVDFAVSGSTSVMDRPAFHSMVSEAPSLNPRPIALLVYEVSRLVRNFQEFFRLLDIVENRMGASNSLHIRERERASELGWSLSPIPKDRAGVRGKHGEGLHKAENQGSYG